MATEALRGEGASLAALFYEYATSELQDVNNLTIQITRVSDNVVIVAETDTGITHPSTGMYLYTWTVPSDADFGNYLAFWRGEDQDGDEAEFTEVFTVVAEVEAVPTTWATVAEVNTITGVTVTEPELNLAQGLIDLHAGVTILMYEKLRARDLHWLKYALAYQAVWQRSQPGFFTKSSVESVSTDGTTINFASEAAQMLGPMAMRALKNLSWKGPRRVRLGRPTSVGGVSFLNESSDSSHGWKPMGRP